ncbi:hypothetical protein V2J09_009979 [Rumex salicifolius]
MEGGDRKQLQQTVTCAVVSVNHATNFYYTVCSVCEKPLPDSSPSLCSVCHRFNSFNPPSKRLFRVIVSIASDSKVFEVICFDRAARVLFGCSADDFFHFAQLHPFAATTAAEIMEGEMFRMTLANSKSGNAQHPRVVSIVPLNSGYQPVFIYIQNVTCADHDLETLSPVQDQMNSKPPLSRNT